MILRAPRNLALERGLIDLRILFGGGFLRVAGIEEVTYGVSRARRERNYSGQYEAAETGIAVAVVVAKQAAAIDRAHRVPKDVAVAAAATAAAQKPAAPAAKAAGGGTGLRRRRGFLMGLAVLAGERGIELALRLHDIAVDFQRLTP